ncbi:hypothetical protein E6W39_19400 [Kitasatospora acidiphila]|uniref:Uncharacterized protein n=1 Tax=Kitasatospora acidiphila TaxID=2567942 RepID=A0A540W4S5_9ACTN|nr:hypothetical protein [Kitasatospora acidiphila]TQF04000.1 hypothetical protein E6W39_19400 [Kitasatospora acidiphila]
MIALCGAAGAAAAHDEDGGSDQIFQRYRVMYTGTILVRLRALHPIELLQPARALLTAPE